jgi:poly(3-hydroxybutyrate) depolymerase
VNGAPLVLPEGETLGETLDLSGLTGRLEVIVRYGSRRPASSLGVTAVRRVSIHYIAHDGHASSAQVVLPSWYGPAANPPLPLVISPHGRGLSGRANSILWGNLPGRGSFAVINPDARGRRVPGHSWGAAGQIADLARMPEILRTTVPWLRIDHTRIYAFGGSMGGQETLLLLGQYPQVLAGAVAMDSVTNLHRRYGDFALSPKTRGLQALARLEIGGTPRTNPTGYVLRSPTHWLEQVAKSGVPLQLWWSLADQIVLDQVHQSGHFYEQLRKLKPKGPVKAVTGHWLHSQQMRTQMPEALRFLGLLR